MEQIATHSVEKSSDLTNLAGKYLTFLLDKEEYGIEIMKVQAICSYPTVFGICATHCQSPTSSLDDKY